MLHRSRAQLLIDACEDREDKKATLELNLSGIGATRFSSRIYDLVHLRRLVLSNNNLTKINTDIKFLVK
jgi:Leucine-rich repeat (LRR) protein